MLGWRRRKMVAYHDDEWGVPLHDDAQALRVPDPGGDAGGLSWRTILHKRENFRKAFHGFDVLRVSRYGQPQIGD